MTKHEEYQLQFYKKLIPNSEPFYTINNDNASNMHKPLAFISVLPYSALKYLISTIEKIQNAQPYTLDFYIAYEQFIVFDLQFTYPYFYVDGDQLIHMDDLRLLLLEWIDFLKT